MKLIFLGAPGAGKGTQAESICARLSIPAISTGNILKAAIKNGTELGKRAKTYMDDGRLVPDDIVIGIVRERLSEPDCADGFLFDGFPRTVAQAEALESMGVAIDRVINIAVPDDKIVGRISGRRSCPKCGSVYHIRYRKPQTEGKCDACGNELIIRSDDEADTVRKRLEVYHAYTQPLETYYCAKGLLSTVDGDTDPVEVTARICEALGI